MGELIPIKKQIIDDVEQRLAKFDASLAYNGGYGYDAANRMAADMRALLDVAKQGVEPNVTIDLIHDPDGAIERITVAASSVRIETHGGVRVEYAADSPSGHHVVRFRAPSKLTMRASGDVAVITDQPYLCEHIPPERGAVHEYR